jgi:tetratricopeptide (TPR) repeat protein
MWALSYMSLRAVYHSRGFRTEYVKPIMTVGDAGTAAIIATLGGFRNVAASLLWLRLDQYWHMGGMGWWKMYPVLQTITELDPHFILAWRTFGWHCAWNLNSDAPADEKPRWIEEGIRIFKRGIDANPDSWELHMELAWLYMDRIREAEKSIPWWQKTVKKPGAPEYTWHMMAHAYERTADWRAAMAIWQQVARKFPKDVVAHLWRDRWQRASKDPLLRQKELCGIWARENAIRRNRVLPPKPAPINCPPELTGVQPPK